MNPSKVLVDLVDLYFAYLLFTLDKEDPTLPAIRDYIKFRLAVKLMQFLF